MSKLVIVESPTKIKKIQQFLPPGFVVDSCVGHIRDLPSKKSEIPAKIKNEPWADFGVDYTDGFKPTYITIRGKGKVITELRRKLKDADELYLATDEDREGEAIAWHLVEALKPKVPVKRMVFNEITKKAVLDALANPRDMNNNLVQAQETRRILDRLYGYAISPLLWKKVGGNLSAGRVQSVAVRLVVMRERERRAFVKGSYWDLQATLRKDSDFQAKLTHVDGTPVATGADFDKDTGRIAAGKNVLLLEEEAARALEAKIRHAPWIVESVEQKERETKPYAPFTTSTLQQEANNRLNYGARRTMDIAQRLYQNGFITYMRTDSTLLSQEALDGAREAIRKEFGDAAYDGPKQYGKNKKGAQEAHEAIRPAGEQFVHPKASALSGDELSLYTLIYRRTLASQMANERALHTTVRFAVENASFKSSGKEVLFPGWRAAYAQIKESEHPLPDLQQGDAVDLVELSAEGHETKPPARFTEASLVKALEEEAIGRPSTYASIMDTITRRGYVIQKGKSLVPSFTAFAVVGILEANFPELVDTAFTAKMENTLDDIAAGEAEVEPFLAEFFNGKDGLQAQIAKRMETMDPATARIIDLGEQEYVVKIGRFGAYVEAEVDGEVGSATLPEAITPDELTAEMALQLVRNRLAGPTSLGTHPEHGVPVYALDGRYGPYYQLGDQEEGSKVKPKRASLPKGKSVEDATLEEAVTLLSLPRELGPHPACGIVIAGLGRFGPFVAHDPQTGDKADFRNLPDTEDVYTVSFEKAMELLLQPKGRGRGRAGPLKELGQHPRKKKPMTLHTGRYGPYIKCDKTNATVPKDKDPLALTTEEAIALVDEKEAKNQ